MTVVAGMIVYPQTCSPRVPHLVPVIQHDVMTLLSLHNTRIHTQMQAEEGGGLGVALPVPERARQQLFVYPSSQTCVFVANTWM